MPRVRKAVLPVAGLGTRFLPATKAIPKEMLTIVDRPLIQYAVEECLAAGIEEAELERISAPIGLDIGALTAAETALSIMSEIISLRRGRAGGRLINARGRIHDATPA